MLQFKSPSKLAHLVLQPRKRMTNHHDGLPDFDQRRGGLENARPRHGLREGNQRQVVFARIGDYTARLAPPVAGLDDDRFSVVHDVQRGGDQRRLMKKKPLPVPNSVSMSTTESATCS